MCEQPRRRCESSTCRRSRRSSARARRLRAPSSPAPAAPRRRAPHRRTRLRLIRPAQLCDVSIDVCGAVYFVLVRREDLHRIGRLMPPRRIARVVLRPVQRGLVLDARAPRRDSLAHRPPLSIHRRSLRCESKTKHDVSIQLPVRTKIKINAPFIDAANDAASRARSLNRITSPNASLN